MLIGFPPVIGLPDDRVCQFVQPLDVIVRQLAVRFDFEDEWQKNGGNIRSRAFYTALRQELSRLVSEVTLCRK